MVHKIGGIIAYNIDIVIITAVQGLTAAAIYGQYLYIVNSLTTIINKISTSATAGIGDLIVRSKEKSLKLFNEMNSLCFFIGTIVCIPLLCAINSFILIWHEGRIETNTLVAVMFVLNAFYFTIRMPLISFSTSGGFFKETKKCTILEAIINLSLSLILVNKLGIAGVLIATFIAYIISDYLIRPAIIYKNIFGISVKKYYLDNLIYITITVICALIALIIYPKIPSVSYLNWSIYSLAIFIVNFIITLGLYYLAKKVYFIDRFKSIFLKLKNKKKNEDKNEGVI